MPNKYNIRAKRLALDSIIRERAWGSFQTSFSQLSSLSYHDEKDDGGENTCQAIVQCCNHKTTHRTLLHSLCAISSDSSPPPPQLIYTVACACPRALMLHESVSGDRTPLHLAIAQKASLKTIQALMEAADNDETLKRKEILSALDSKGQTPLLLAARGGNDENIVKYLVSQDIDGSSLLISCLRKKKHQQNNACVPLNYVASNASLFVGDGLDNPQDLLRFMIVRSYHARLKQSYPKFYNFDAFVDNKNEFHSIGGADDNTCLLQAAVFCYDLFGSSKVASSIISYIIRNELFHRDRLDSRRDSAGNLTLHIACLSDTTKFVQILKLGERISDYGLNSDDCTLMEYLVNAIPSPCTVPFLSKNIIGEIPLHCAIKSRKDWSQIQLLIDACPSSVKFCTSKGELPLHLSIKCGNPMTEIIKLWNYYPESSSIADASTGLYPFQLAAVFGEKERQGKGKKKGVQPGDIWDNTSLSFFLLRGCPSLISASLLATQR